MANFQEILNKIKENNPNMYDNLKTIKKSDGTPVFTDEKLIKIREKLREIYEKNHQEQ